MEHRFDRLALAVCGKGLGALRSYSGSSIRFDRDDVRADGVMPAVARRMVRVGNSVLSAESRDGGWDDANGHLPIRTRRTTSPLLSVWGASPD